ncbi:MAG: RdgB/HAM1 family non-canonical purine NTP pyrophosphatase, partial [Acetanaerobacterium sp.]
EETGTTFEENARIKAAAVCAFSGLPAVSDDSGLCIDALGGEPGVYSARYLGENTPYERKNRLVLDQLLEVPKEKRTARYECCVCCVFPDGAELVAHGTCEGAMGYEPRGENGFGYDPIFVVGDKSMAELSDQEKNRISHRAKAVHAFVQMLKQTR